MYSLLEIYKVFGKPVGKNPSEWRTLHKQDLFMQGKLKYEILKVDGKPPVKTLMGDSDAVGMYKDWLDKNTQNPSIKFKERIALDTVEQILEIKLLRQYKVLNYLVDGYDPVNNVVYEIDEEHHKYNLDKDKYRQEVIQREIGCRFIRIKV